MLDLQQKDNSFAKAEQENVEQEKIEHKLIGTFNRTRGLRLFAYNILNETLHEVDEIFEGDLYIMRDELGKLRAYEVGHSRVYVDSNDEHFECLNLENAKRRVKKFKEGKIKSLNNIKKPTHNKINLY